MKPLRSYFTQELSKISRLTDLENQYLINLLINYNERSMWIDQSLAIEYLKNTNKNPKELLNLADFSLFLTGYFPEKILNSVNHPDYYTQIGQRAYEEVGYLVSDNFYKQLSKNFKSLKTTLNQLSFNQYTEYQQITALYKIWQETQDIRVKEKLNTLLKK